MATEPAEHRFDSTIQTDDVTGELLRRSDLNGHASRPRHQPLPESLWRPIRRSDLKLGLKDKLLFWMMVATMHAVSLLPDFILYRLGVLAGDLVYRYDHRHVRIGMKNLSLAFPEKSEAERARILRESYRNLGRTGAEYTRLGGFFRHRLVRRVTYSNFDGWVGLQRKYRGKGILALTAHFGNFELLPSAHAMHGYQIALVHHTQRFLAGDALMTYIRERAGVEIIRKHSAARAVLRGLRAGDLIGIPFDQNAKRSEATWVPFFGEPAATITGLARVARISGAPVMPVFIVRQPDMRSHKIEIFDEVPQQRTSDADADWHENTAQFVKAVEEIVRKYPEQFLWIHRRYRTRPRGMPPVYDN
jgi:Kdo2-lipid IVA lauroyltransferase/acyltransferase